MLFTIFGYHLKRTCYSSRHAFFMVLLWLLVLMANDGGGGGYSGQRGCFPSMRSDIDPDTDFDFLICKHSSLMLPTFCYCYGRCMVVVVANLYGVLLCGSLV